MKKNQKDFTFLEGAEGDASGNDEIYDQAAAVVAESREVSIAMLQRKLRVGYNRAARMIEKMEHGGVIGPSSGNKRREVYIKKI